jgi:sensor histidine kinase YesM
MSLFEKILRYQKRHRLVSHLFFWLAILIISITSSQYHDRDQFIYSDALIDDGLFLIPQIMASYFIAYFIIPGFFFRKKYFVTILYFIIGSYLICVLSRFLVVRVLEPMAGIAPEAFETTIELITDIPKLLYVYFFNVFSIAFVFLLIKLVKDQLEIQKHTLSLEKEKAETELKLLKTQLNPHFLFNTLNNIYSLSLSNSPVTSASIGRLAEILDHILYRCNGIQVPLKEEIVLLNNYIALEKLRYNDRLQVNFKTQVDHDIEIPPLILLSIVENAFKHGASEDIGNPYIHVNLYVTKNVFQCIVSNSFTPEVTKNANDQIGLFNVRKQLELIYPESHSLTLSIDQASNAFTVTLVIDLKKS